ncbi:MFS transporter [Aminobacterium mobile]|uniref:MFS transporter n=1 Tax=Aminobacterium mobile TaxID=81467 RepID=UPI000466F1DE|nr:MFS transporter [Aminobacterium mobile]
MTYSPVVFQLLFMTFSAAAMDSGYYFLPAYFPSVGFDTGPWLGWIMGAGYGVSALSRPFAPLIVERIGLDRSLKVGFLLLLVASVALAVGPLTVGLAIFYKVLLGFGFTLQGVSMIAYQMVLVPKQTRGRDIALISLGYVLPSLILAPCLEWILLKGYPHVYSLTLVVVVLGGLLLSLRFRGELEHPSLCKEEKGAASYKEIFTMRPILAFMAVMFVFSLVDAMQITFVSLAYERHLVATAFFLPVAVTSLAIRTLGGSLLNRFPRRLLAGATTFVTAIGILGTSFASSSWQLVFLGIFFGIGMGIGFPAMTCLVGDLGDDRTRTKLAAIYGLLYSGTFFIVPAIISSIAAYLNYTIAYRLVSIAFLSLNVAAFRWSYGIQQAATSQNIETISEV